LQVSISLPFTVNAGEQVIRNNGRFPKGNSGNPYGRRGRTASLISNEVVKIIQEEAKEEWPQIIKKVIKMVNEEGNIPALRWLSDYAIGKPTETINVIDDSATDLLPHLATKEAREKASEIFKRAMEEVQNLSKQ
jgi:hydrogenase maturation factor